MRVMARSSSSEVAFRVSAKPKKPVTAEIVGEVYTVKAPKSSLLLAISRHSSAKDSDANSINRDLETILKLMFGKEWVKVQERLDDPEDELDIDHIFESIENLTEAATGNPT
jgi:hypothetical protein